MILRGISDPNVIVQYDKLRTNKHILVLEYIPGRCLVECVDVQTYLKEHVSQKVFAQIISAVGYLHRKGIVHPTVSCSEVLLDSDQNAFLTGFSNVKTLIIQDRPIHDGQLYRGAILLFF